MEKIKKPFPRSVTCSIPSNLGPEGGVHMGWGKGNGDVLMGQRNGGCWMVLIVLLLQAEKPISTLSVQT